VGTAAAAARVEMERAEVAYLGMAEEGVAARAEVARVEREKAEAACSEVAVTRVVAPEGEGFAAAADIGAVAAPSVKEGELRRHSSDSRRTLALDSRVLVSTPRQT